MNKLGYRIINLVSIPRHFPCKFSIRTYSASSENKEKIKKYKENKANTEEDALRTTLNLYKDELSRASKGDFSIPKRKVPKYSDYVVIGGGIMGSSIAYAMKNRAPESFDVTVIERDPKYIRSASALSVGGIRQQFSLEENIRLSMYSAEFLRNIKQHLSVLDDDPPDIQFQPHGYLFLATEAGVEQMIKNHKLQLELGAKVKLLNSIQLKQKFPWINVEGIVMGSYGVENEGWFDPWALLSAFKKKAISLGADYVNAEVIGFEFENASEIRGEGAGDPVLKTNYVYVQDNTGEVHCIEFSCLIIAAGPYSGEVASMLNIGSGPGILESALPVEPRKRYVYVVCCPDGPGIDMPLTVDPTCTYVRREGLGGKYICGRSPLAADEPDISNLEVDYNFFENSVWPILAHRIPSFENLKISSAWAGYYDYNTFDQNLIIGNHPYFPNVFFATGLSGHGIQMAPGIGRAVMELMLDKTYVSIDLSRFHVDRIFCNQPLFEKCIV